MAYEREWAGSARIEGDRVTLFFTGAGVAARPHGYQQALYEVSGRLVGAGPEIRWEQPVPMFRAVPPYMPADAHDGEAGKIKAFRDPSFFCDPADGAEYLIFTGSLAAATSAYNGAVGIARRTRDGWRPLAPLIHADGVNNELERAHLVWAQGRYYAFWATQRATFAPALRHAPTGLYGMVADRLLGPYRPLNGSGLVLANPDAAPGQSYSWSVTADLIVASFVDELPDGAGGTYFVGLPAPLLRLSLEGDRCALAPDAVAA
jgi:levansucrase